MWYAFRPCRRANLGLTHPPGATLAIRHDHASLYPQNLPLFLASAISAATASRFVKYLSCLPLPPPLSINCLKTFLYAWKLLKAIFWRAMPGSTEHSRHDGRNTAFSYTSLDTSSSNVYAPCYLLSANAYLCLLVPYPDRSQQLEQVSATPTPVPRNHWSLEPDPTRPRSLSLLKRDIYPRSCEVRCPGAVQRLWVRAGRV